MPPWVARQWHVRRALHSAPRAWCRYQRLSRCPSVPTSRSYAQTSTLDDNSYTISTANSAIIIPRSVNTQPEDLISHIQPVDRARLTRDRFAVFFVTPAFAPWLLDDEVFLRKALRQTYAHLLDWEKLSYARIHALCAVVDKLPTPKAIGDAKNLPAAALERMKQPPVSETGYEGMAYTTLRFHDSVIADAPTGADGKAAISFITSERVDASGDFGDALRLPLANTVFQTGLPSTMTYSTWSKRKGESDLVLKEKRNVTHHGIRFHQGAPIKQCISTLAVPLIPLTVPRRVDASMGNILRRVIGPAGTSVAASQELERIVPQYYKARGESSQATSVWALLIPKELMMPVLQKTNLLLGRHTHAVGSSAAASEDELWEALWKRDPTLWNDLVPTALVSSARLHRVLSGGGGWGTKAGLLSLDPVATTEDVKLPTPSMSDEPSDLSSALHQVAHNGDYIQFFISPSATSPASNDPEAQSKELKESVEATTPWGWELGTIPSTVDSFPGGSWQHEAPASRDVFIFKHSFGALAEGGLVLHRQFKLKPGDAYSLISGSKVDVPFSRFSAVNTEAKEETVEEDSMHNFFDSKPTQHHSVLVRRLYGEDAPRLLGLGRLDTSSGQQQLNRLELELPQVDWEVAPVRKITAHRDSPNLATQTKLEPKLAMHKVPAKNNESPEKQPSAVIRYITYTDEVDYCVDKLRQGQKIVQRLTHEYRTTMNTIMRSNKRPMDLAVKRLGDDLSKGTRARIHQTQDYVNKLAMKADSIDVKLYRLQKEFQDIINAATQRVLDQLLARVQHIIASVAHLRNEFARVLNFIVQHARFTHYTNNSAVRIYQLHISLRWRLGDMIFTRRQYPHSHPMAYSILPLEEKLVKMRAYGSNLFYGRKKMSVPYVRQQLIEMEGQNLELRNLKLSEPAEWRGKIAALPVAEQIERNRNARLGRVIKNHGLRVYENFGKAVNATKSRHIAFSPSDEPFVRDRRKSRRERKRIHGRNVPIRKTGYLVFRKTASSRRMERIANKKSGSPVFRKTLISRRREKIANEKRSLHLQLVRKKGLRRWLADTVSGWLGNGGGEGVRKEEHGGWDSAERVFGGSGKYNCGQGGVDSSSEIPLHNDADLLPEVQREGGYGVGSYGQQTSIQGRFRGDFGRNIDSLPSDGGDHIFSEDVGKLTSFRSAQDCKDAFSTNLDRPAGFLHGQGGGGPFIFPDNDDELTKKRTSKK